MARSIAFVQPRGGIGKSTSVVQLAASLAATRPDLTVIVLDASVHGDASTLLLGGMQEREPGGEQAVPTAHRRISIMWAGGVALTPAM